jgi:hypothetical protein
MLAVKITSPSSQMVVADAEMLVIGLLVIYTLNPSLITTQPVVRSVTSTLKL